MNKRKKYLVKAVSQFVLLRAVEFTVLYFLVGFLLEHFSGWHFYAILGGVVLVYLMYVVGMYVDDWSYRHKYDDVIL